MRTIFSKTYTLLIAACCLLLAATGCVKERFSNGETGDGEAWVELSFGAAPTATVETKSTFSDTEESQLYNFYLFIFNKQGNRVFGRMFDSSNRKNSAAEVSAAGENCWYVANTTSGSSTATNGVIKVHASEGDDMRIYMLANLDADMVRISSDLLAHEISSESDLLNFKLYLNQFVVFRNGYFPMSGALKNVTISKNTAGSSLGNLRLKRIDAKVRFIFKTGSRDDASAAGQHIESFEARQWRVVNVPRTAYAIESNMDAATVPPTANDAFTDYAQDFFDTEYVNFEDFPSSTQSEFSFYMLENRQTPKVKPPTYQDRSRCEKTAEGLNETHHVEYVLNGQNYSRDMKIFEYANDFSTYVEVTGYVKMKLNNDEAGQVLGGEVKYMIHLGDWNAVIDNSGRGDSGDVYSNFDNFDTERNTSYTYTVTVNSVNSIRVEVETSQGDGDVVESQPGASGDISIAKEEIALCDAHYVSKTLTFHLKNFFEGGLSGGKLDPNRCIVDQLTWRVKTPFGEGEPRSESGIEITEGLDYKWVHFRLNKTDKSGDYFSTKRRRYTPLKFEESTEYRDSTTQNIDKDGTPGLAGYHNDGIMDVPAIVEYIKKQVHQFMVNPDLSAFDNKNDLDKAKICVTVFVDEYYYDKNPLTEVSDKMLWKRFVNAEDRYMYILCNSEVSRDQESRATGSVITIQQHSIQSIYNTDRSYDALSTAWGTEYTDEYDGRWRYWKDGAASENRGNNDPLNGLLNTAREWGLCRSNSTSFVDGNSWNTYMDYEVTSDTPDLKSDYQYLRYACMSRNRDNNGDGKIDRDEVRWYMAATRQLVGLFVGQGLLHNDSRLYNRSAEDRKSDDVNLWMQHVISSTIYSQNSNSNDPEIIWAEEGISTGPYSYSSPSDPVPSKMTVRCVRNLGYIDGSTPSEDYSLDKMPEDYIQLDGNVFTATHLNEKALRYYSSRELPLASETSTENHLYKKFQVAASPVTGPDANFYNFNANIDKAIAAGQNNPYCPEGYRAPNQIELTIMLYYGMTEGFRGTLMTRTFWSFGALGSGKITNKYGFCKSDGHISLYAGAVTNTTRCVRDIRVD